MRKSFLAIGLAGSVALSACASNPRVAQDAAIGAAGGAAVGAVVPGVSTIEGAAIGAAIGGLAGAVWTDQNNDGYVDGYTYNNQYYPGTPQGYDPTLHRVATGALGNWLGEHALNIVFVRNVARDTGGLAAGRDDAVDGRGHRLEKHDAK